MTSVYSASLVSTRPAICASRIWPSQTFPMVSARRRETSVPSSAEISEALAKR